MKLSIRKLAELTGKSRDTVSSILDAARLAYAIGAKNAREFESSDALAAIYTYERKGGTLDEARKRQHNAAAALSEMRAEVISKERIPMGLCVALEEKIMMAYAAALKGFCGKTMTRADVNALFTTLREMGARFDWPGFRETTEMLSALRAAGLIKDGCPALIDEAVREKLEDVRARS